MSRLDKPYVGSLRLPSTEYHGNLPQGLRNGSMSTWLGHQGRACPALIESDMQSKQISGQPGSAAGVAAAPKASSEQVLRQCGDAHEFCATLAKMFGLRLTEVALLRADKGLLKFVFPEELKTAGAIPVSSSSAIAAHTASTKKVEMFNTFAKIKHARVFESVRLTSKEDSEKSEQLQIQKLMSAPILDPERKVLGVIQVCRKGFDLSSSGPDFTLQDLQKLEMASLTAAKMPFMKANG